MRIHESSINFTFLLLCSRNIIPGRIFVSGISVQTKLKKLFCDGSIVGSKLAHLDFYVVMYIKGTATVLWNLKQKRSLGGVARWWVRAR